MRYHMAGRLIYILDVRMTRDQLKELPPSALEPPLRPLLDYTLAIRELRRDDFRQAALALEEFLKKYSEAETQDLSPLCRVHDRRGMELYPDCRGRKAHGWLRGEDRQHLRRRAGQVKGALPG